jgi:hypothetical protein
MTGHVSNALKNGEDFNAFVWNCARAFGALVDIRGNSEAKIPKQLKQSNYYKRIIAESKKALAALPKKAAAKLSLGEKLKEKDLKWWQRQLDEVVKNNAKISSLLTEAKEWIPPTKDHENLKEYMVTQLTSSLNDTGYYHEAISQAMNRTPLEYIEKREEELKDNIIRCTKHQEEEDNSIESKNKWLKELRNSVPLPKSKL